MHRAKKSIAHRICSYEHSMDGAQRAQSKLMSDLREALAANAIELHYQVQALVATGEITGYEALLRWTCPDRGPVPPSEFVPLAEETGLILPLGEWVLRRACTEAAAWPYPHKLAVNISAVQLANADLPRLVHQVLIDTGLRPSRLELEITETGLIVDPDHTTHVLRRLRALGVSIAMDDFGTGYSSLSMLRAFAFDKIKLDKSFMHETDRAPEARAILCAVLALGKSLNIPVLAEGVETEDHLRLLREHGCDQAQGYWLGRPSRHIATSPASVSPRFMRWAS